MAREDFAAPVDSLGQPSTDLRVVVDLDEPDQPVHSELHEWWLQQREGSA